MYVAGSSAPSPLRFAPCIFIGKIFQLFFPLASTLVDLRLPTLLIDAVSLVLYKKYLCTWCLALVWFKCVWPRVFRKKERQVHLKANNSTVIQMPICDSSRRMNIYYSYVYMRWEINTVGYTNAPGTNTTTAPIGKFLLMHKNPCIPGIT